MRSAAAGGLALCAGLVLAGQLPVGAAGAWLSAVGIAGTVPALILIGVAGVRSRARRRAMLVVAVLGAVLVASCAGLVAISSRGGGGLAGGGGGLGLAVLLAGVWLVPLLVVALGHAWSFDRGSD